MRARLRPPDAWETRSRLFFRLLTRVGDEHCDEGPWRHWSEARVATGYRAEQVNPTAIHLFGNEIGRWRVAPCSTTPHPKLESTWLSPRSSCLLYPRLAAVVAAPGDDVLFSSMSVSRVAPHHGEVNHALHAAASLYGGDQNVHRRCEHVPSRRWRRKREERRRCFAQETEAYGCLWDLSSGSGLFWMHNMCLR
jgi:hypothetical protein